MEIKLFFCCFFWIVLGGSRAVELVCDEFQTKPIARTTFEKFEGNCSFTFLELVDQNEINLRTPNADFCNNGICNRFTKKREMDVSEKIKQIKISNSKILFIPKEIFQKFPNVESINADKNEIQNISEETFKDAKNIKEISIKYNLIKKLEKTLFSSNENLVRIDFYDNQIEAIETSAFSNLVNLKKLFISENRIKELQKEHFEDLTNLELIDLRSNQLEVIVDDLFLANRNLRSIHLNYNKIKTVGSAFDGLRLDKLYLSNNLIEELNLENCTCRTVAVDKNKLKLLKLSVSVKILTVFNNELENIVFSDNSDLVYLNVSTNNLTSDFLSLISSMKSLKTLDLSNNFIGKLNLTSFLKMEQLKILDLQNTNLTGIDFGTFVHQSELQELDISYNNLREIDLHMFTNQKALETLYIEGNSLTSIDYQLIKNHFPALSVIGISDNLWNCTYLAQMAVYLKSNAVDISPLFPIKNSTNIDGVACYNDKNVKEISFTPMKQQHSHISGNSNINIDLMELTDKFGKILEHMNSTRNDYVTKDDFISELSHLKSAILTEISQLKDEVYNNKISISLSSTNKTLQFSRDIDILMNKLNNMTLDRQAIANEKFGLRVSSIELKMENLGKTLDRVVENMKNLSIIQPDRPLEREAALAASYVPENSDQTTKVIVILMFVLTIITCLFVVGKGVFDSRQRRYLRRCQSETNTLREDIF